LPGERRLKNDAPREKPIGFKSLASGVPALAAPAAQPRTGGSRICEKKLIFAPK
jgi:hypothetical protein